MSRTSAAAACVFVKVGLQAQVHAGARVGESGPHLRTLRRREPEHDQSLRFRVGERTEQDPVYKAEDQRVGADPQRKREDDDERSARLSRRHSDGIAGILQELADDGHHTHRASPRVDGFTGHVNPCAARS
jgi:hypothetical protein